MNSRLVKVHFLRHTGSKQQGIMSGSALLSHLSGEISCRFAITGSFISCLTTRLQSYPYRCAPAQLQSDTRSRSSTVCCFCCSALHPLHQQRDLYFCCSLFTEDVHVCLQQGLSAESSPLWFLHIVGLSNFIIRI